MFMDPACDLRTDETQERIRQCEWFSSEGVTTRGTQIGHEYVKLTFVGDTSGQMKSRVFHQLHHFD